ncbi:uncharacterized protein LOC129716439 [Leucoraja erinacea]|uniref:uncharacterized protein LOC129716439 n=1 Tax=Leucoraja erinaceus TaxID=7782 RepID=UPI002458AB58|nr:uncharacterized protein LOC129716439 [Leucoraja erinacea]
MRRSIGKVDGLMWLLWLLAGLHTAALCRAGTAATAGSITTVPVGGTVMFPILHHSQERFEVAMGRVHPDLAILAWKSDSPEYPYMVRQSYRNRVRFRRDTFIELRAVRPGDQGTYEVQTNYLGKELRDRDREHFELRVIGLHTAALCRAGTAATAGSITTIPVGGTVMFPVLHHSQERFEVAMGRVHPDLAILAWKSDSPEYPYMVRPSYRNRVHFRRDTFIELRAVRPGDQGTYEVQTNYLGKELRNRDREHFELRVIEPMSTPTVEVSHNSSHLTLNCSTTSGCPVTYRWERRSQDPGVGNATFPGAVLYLQHPGQHICAYSCVAEDCCSSRAVPAMLHCNAQPRGSMSRWVIVLSVVPSRCDPSHCCRAGSPGIESPQKPC